MVFGSAFRRNRFVINNEYIVRDYIASGSQGNVYLVTDKKNREYAAKFQKIDSSGRSLLLEASHLVRANENTGSGKNRLVPAVHYYGEQGDYRIMVMTLLGKDLIEMFKDIGQFTTKTLLMLAIDCLYRLEVLHSCGMIHRDIKPDNIAIGKGSVGKGNILIIDYGLAENYRNENGVHWNQTEGHRFQGTPDYAAINAHLGKRQSRKDDLEGLFYSLLELGTGSLPWMDCEDRNDILLRKESKSAEEICEGLPNVFRTFYEEVRSLSYESTPDYHGYRKMFRRAMLDCNYKLDGKYDWMDRMVGFRRMWHSRRVCAKQKKKIT